MAWRPHSRAKVNPRNPKSWGRCDRDGLIYNLRDLVWDYQWEGNRLVNLRFLVCRRCRDIPNQQLRSRILPADPVPVLNARPENYALIMAGGFVQPPPIPPTPPITGIFLLDESGQPLLDENGNPILIESQPTPILTETGQTLETEDGSPLLVEP